MKFCNKENFTCYLKEVVSQHYQKKLIVHKNLIEYFKQNTNLYVKVLTKIHSAFVYWDF